jgi:hypothetical protein
VVQTLAGAVIATGGLFALSLLWLGPPKPTAGGLDTTQLLDVVKLTLAVVAGVGGVVALVVAYRKQLITEAGETREQTKLYAERFDKASDKLGSDSAAVRLAGVHALAALADDWEGGRQMCIDVLCAYLRMPLRPEPDHRADADLHADWQAMREVRATILRLIATHLRMDGGPTWHGADFDFRGAVFDAGADFSRVKFSGGTFRFNGAEFSDGGFSFIRAKFADGAVLFDGAKFTGAMALFDHAKFSGARVSFTHVRFQSGQVSFAGARFESGYVSFEDADFIATVSVLFNYATFLGGQVVFHDVWWHERPGGLPDEADGLTVKLRDEARVRGGTA